MGRWQLALALAGALFLAGCEARSHTVTYQVGGSAPTVAVSYVNATGATEQRDVRGGWSASFTATTWAHVRVTAFNPTPGGSVSCRLYVDGVLVQAATSEGAWKLASCGALAGVTGTTPTPARQEQP